MFDREDLEFVTALSLYTGTLIRRTREFVKNTNALKSSNERLSLLEDEIRRCHIVGRHPKLLSAFDQVCKLAAAGASVMLRADTGTGKELFARAYADNSDRRGKSYVPVPIPALAPTVIESELFGHVKGAFTEARQDKKGRFEVAHGGVLFLDEVGDIAPSLQPKLLRFLDSGELYRVGDTKPRYVDAYVVSATNRPIEKMVEKMVEEGRYRADLLARLGQTVRLPSLQERQEDIVALVEHFSAMYNRGPIKKQFAHETLEVLQAYRWEFNVRQLAQVVQTVMCLSDNDVILPSDLPDYIREHSPLNASGGVSSSNNEMPRSLKEVMDEHEKNAHRARARVHERKQAQSHRASQDLSRYVLQTARAVRPAQKERLARPLPDSISPQTRGVAYNGKKQNLEDFGGPCA